MNRRSFSLALASALVMGLAGPVQAKSLSERVERALKREGWRDIEVSRTLLGRTRVTARRGEVRREIILNTRNGEVLRDVMVHDRHGVGSVFDEDDNGQGRGRGRGQNEGRGEGGRGGGEGGGRGRGGGND
jgi:hypothetical protein